VFAGAAPGVATFPSLALDAADPEPLHALAIRLAGRLGFLDGPLAAAPFGDGVAVTGARGLVVDFVPAPDVHDAIPDVASRFARRASQPPRAIEVLDRLPTADHDGIGEVDVPAVPDAWRPALWAGASLLRAAAAARWGARLRDTRGWPAVVVGSDRVELERASVNGVAAGTWLPASVSLGEIARQIVVR
jgi:hypothetical protein